MAKVLIIDPPSGWMYGFPKPIPKICLNSNIKMQKFLVENGYPDCLLDSAMKYSRYWEIEEEDLKGRQ